jgi:hypothetical protein
MRHVNKRIGVNIKIKQNIYSGLVYGRLVLVAIKALICLDIAGFACENPPALSTTGGFCRWGGLEIPQKVCQITREYSPIFHP